LIPSRIEIGVASARSYPIIVIVIIIIIMSKPIPSQSDDSPVAESSSYTVLYYKRKNKVHKTKGVSKMDGILMTTPPPESLVTLLTDSSNVVVFRGIQKEISNRDLQVDDVIVLGGYEVEILSKDSSSKTITQSSLVASDKKQPARPKIRGPLHPKANRPIMASRAAPRRTYQPRQPKKTSAAFSDNDSSENESDDLYAGPNENSRLALHNKRNLGSATTSTFRPLMSKKQKGRTVSPLPSRTGAFQPIPQRPAQPATDSSFFPGAIGNLDVPHSIKSVLKPHQTKGVTFLWNCLTGNGKVVSPHAMEKLYKGAILADEMGLGKTLMTIAVICALHRQRREMVRYSAESRRVSRFLPCRDE
jgi:hypothetical protein